MAERSETPNILRQILAKKPAVIDLPVHNNTDIQYDNKTNNKSDENIVNKTVEQLHNNTSEQQINKTVKQSNRKTITKMDNNEITQHNSTTDKQYNNKTGKQYNSKKVRQLDNNTITQEDSKTDIQINNIPVEGQSDGDNLQSEKRAFADKVRMTYYLSQDIIDTLDESWYRLRRKTLQKDRDKISKSVMVEVAVRMALEDLEKEGPSSAFLRAILSQM